ncbi:MAG: substrate-binding domain-containing protein [Hyphomicrobiaceae bacterium]
MRTFRNLATAIAAVGLVTASGAVAHAEDPFIVVQSTTSTDNSGLFKHILPMFKKATGIDVRVVAVGTGQAIKNAENGDGDVLFVHAKKSEEEFVAKGGGVKRFDVMYNDFVIVGPKADPAKVDGMKDAPAALKKIAEAKAPFASRGDDSGTHKAELRLWKGAAVDVGAAGGEWYRSTGSGMGATLNTAAGMGAYALTDRATWSSFKNKADMKILVEGDKKLFNQYGVILVSPDKHKHVKVKEGQAFIDWLLSAEGQNAIRSFQIGGEQQFFPNADPGQMKKAG